MLLAFTRHLLPRFSPPQRPHQSTPMPFANGPADFGSLLPKWFTVAVTRPKSHNGLVVEHQQTCKERTKQTLAVVPMKRRKDGDCLTMVSLLLWLLLFSKSGDCLMPLANAINPENAIAREGPPCRVCVGGEPVPLRDKPLTLGTCGDLEISASQWANGTDECISFQSLGRYCGCARSSSSKNVCSFCPNGDSVTHNEVKVQLLTGTPAPPEPFGFSITDSITCEMAESIVESDLGSIYQEEETGNPIFCLVMQFRSSICGCKPDWRQILLPWASRISGILSIVVSPFQWF